MDQFWLEFCTLNRLSRWLDLTHSRFRSICDKPAAPRLNEMRHYGRESPCAVHSFGAHRRRNVQQGSGEAIAAQFSIGMTEPHHRHSGVV
ncbi:hypothetical protein ACVINW_003866 [Bradyrhizobium sp. USDA 4461]